MIGNKRAVLGRIGAVVLGAVVLGVAGASVLASPAWAEYVYTLRTTTAFGVPYPPFPPGPLPGSPLGTVPSDFVLTTQYDANPATQTLVMEGPTVISPPGVTINTFFTETGGGTFTASDGILSGDLHFSGDEQAYDQLQIVDNDVIYGAYLQDPSSALPPCAVSPSGEQFFSCLFSGVITATYVNTPEPASIGLFAVGLLGLGGALGVRHRKDKKERMPPR